MSVPRILHAGDLVAMLDRHYYLDEKPWAGVGVQEIQSPCQTRRADYLFVPCTVGGGMGELIGHEIKVTRSDVLTEISDPTKADAWAKYCTKWYLVVSDATFVDGLDVPSAWGILAPPRKANGRRMDVIRPATNTIPQSPERALRHVIKHMNSHLGRRVRESEGRATYLDGKITEAQEEVGKLRDQIATMNPVLGGKRIRGERLVELLNMLDRATANDWQWHADNELIVRAIVDHVQVNRIADQMKREISDTLRQLEREFDPFRFSRDQLRKALEKHKDQAKGEAA